VLSLDGDVIPYSRNVKNLGNIMDEICSWCDETKVVYKNVGLVLSRLWQGVTPILTRRRLVQSLIVSLFLYCDVVYSQSSVGVNSLLNVAFNSCARYICGIPMDGSISFFIEVI
jgi:hypothetical protein